MGRRTSRTLPEGQTEFYEYNDSGTLASRTDFNGYTTTYTYDALDRLLTETADPDHPSLTLAHATATITYEYDDAGNLTSSTNHNSSFIILNSESYTYDERGRLVQKTTPQGTLTYTYDAANNLISTTSSNENGVHVSYAYDELNRPATVFDHGAQEPPLAHTYTYDRVGNLASLTYANGVSHTWQYDSLNRLTNLNLANGQGALNSYTYTLSDAGMRTRMAETSGRVVDYTYDNLYRLTSETITGDPYAVNGRSEYTMDLVGNRLRRDSTILLAPSAPDPLEALQSFGYSDNDWLENHTYDANGNTLGSEDGTDTYDFQNRLIRRETTNRDVIDLTYNAFGDRIRKEVGRSLQASRAVEFHIDRNNLTGYAQVVEELRQINGSLTVERSYLYALDLLAQHQLHPPGALEAWLDGTSSTEPVWQTSYYLYDGLGTVRALADDQGFVTDAYFYDAYGVLLNVFGTTPNAYLYTGEQWDADLGMYFLRARYMEPGSGRFWTMDTYEGRGADSATLHKYLYVHGNPVMGIDPSGMFSVKEVLIAFTIGALFDVVATISINAINGTDTTFNDIWQSAVIGGVGGVIGVGAFKFIMSKVAWPLMAGVVGGAVAGAAGQVLTEAIDLFVNRTEISLCEAGERVLVASLGGAALGGFLIKFPLLNSRFVRSSRFPSLVRYNEAVQYASATAVGGGTFLEAWLVELTDLSVCN